MFETVENTSTLATTYASLAKGGWVMIPIALCSLIALTIIIEKTFWGPSRARTVPSKLLNEAKLLIASGRLEELKLLCSSSASPLAAIISSALQDPTRRREDLVASMELVGKTEALRFQKGLSILGSIAAVGPLLGLLGTVSGMITTFAAISAHGSGNPAMLASGISEALISTASGLSIAIPSLLCHRFFVNRSKLLLAELETSALEILEMIVSNSSRQKAA